MPATLPGGTAHALPADLRTILQSSAKARALWEAITPLARTEWICWVISVKTPETRQKHLKHLKRLKADLEVGKRRPCCWAGCPHRTDKALSKTQEWVYGKKTAKRSVQKRTRA